MERLEGLDGAFLSLESPTTHLHILAALVLDPSGVSGGLDLARVRQLVAARLPLVPPFRKRLLEVPFGLQHAALVDDPDFDLDYHVRRASLPEPGGPDELAAFVADLASRPLDRRRPLWEFHVVEGLADGRVALVPKVHHAILDGVSGAEVLAAFFDLSPDPGPIPLFGPAGTGDRGGTGDGGGDGDGRPTGADGWDPGPLPGELARWRDAVGSLPTQADSLLRTVSRTWQAARAVGGRNRQVAGDLPPAPFEAPHTSVNRAISAHRRVAVATLPLADVDRVRSTLGGTVNDVVLATVSGAMRRLFEERGEELDSSLVALVPMSVRAPEERHALGNRVTALLVSLATGLEDPVARLGRVREGMRRAKEQSRALGPDLYAGWAQALFPAVATRLSRLVSNVRLFDHLGPVCNLVVSNVPGPDVPLYLAGARVKAIYPFGPIAEGVGVNVTVLSYEDTLYVGVLGCWDLVPDLEVVARAMEESLDELLSAADRRRRPEQRGRRVRPVPWWHAELPA